MSLRTTWVGLALLCCAPSLGAVTGAVWVEVDNSSADPVSDALAGAIWMSQPGWRTFDLFLTGDVGQRVNAVNFGGDSVPNPLGLGVRALGGPIFNHPGAGGGGALETSPILQGLPVFNLTRFDTYATLGNANLGGSFPSEMYVAGIVSGLHEGTAVGPVRGIWGPNPPLYPLTNSVIDASGMMRMLRITVSSTVTELSGRFQAGLSDPLVVVTLDIPNAIPAAGPVGALCVAGAVFGVRRRRR